MIWLWDGICEIVECLCKESIRFTEAGRDREEWSNIQNSEDRDEIEKQDDVVMIKSWNVNMQFYFISERFGIIICIGILVSCLKNKPNIMYECLLAYRNK